MHVYLNKNKYMNEWIILNTLDYLPVKGKGNKTGESNQIKITMKKKGSNRWK